MGAFSPVHQFCRVGRYAYVGASTVITQDVPPFSRIVTERETRNYGVNAIEAAGHGGTVRLKAFPAGDESIVIRRGIPSRIWL